MLWGVTPPTEADMEAVLTLLPHHRDRILELGALIADAGIDSGLLVDLWRRTGGLGEAESTALYGDLTDLTVLSSGHGTPRLQGFAGHWLHHRLDRSRLAEVDTALLELARDHAGGDQWRRLPIDQTYLWSALTAHLRRAGRHAEAMALVGDLRWTVGQILACGVAAAEAELAVVDAPWARCLAAELAAGAHRLALARDWDLDPAHRDGGSLGAALAGRLSGIPELSAMREDFLASSAGELALVPRSAPPRRALAPVRGFAVGGVLDDLAVARDGSWLAVSTGEYVRVFDLATGRLQCEVKTAWAPVVLACDQSWLATFDDRDARFRITDLHTGETLATVPLGFTDSPWPLGCVAGDTWFAAAPRLWSPQHGYVWDIATGQRLARLPTGCRGLAVFGSSLLVETAANEVLVLDPRTGHTRHRYHGELADFWHPRTGARREPGPGGSGFPGHRRPLALCGRLGWTAVNAADGSLTVRDAESGRERFSLTDTGTHLVTDPNGAWFAWRDPQAPESVIVRDTGDGRTVTTLRHPTAVRNGQVSEDGSTLAVFLDDGQVRIWDVAQWRLRHTTGIGKADRLLLPPDGSWLATARWGRIHIWDTATGEHRMELPEAHKWLASPDSRHLIARTDSHGSIEVYDLGSPVAAAPAEPAPGVEPGKESTPNTADSDSDSTVAVSPDGSHRAVGHRDGSVRLWDNRTGELVLTVHDGDSEAPLCAVGPRGSWLLTSVSGGLRLWDPSSGRAGYGAAADGSTHKLLVAPDGSWFAECGYHASQHGRRLFLGRLTPGDFESVDWGPDLGELALAISPDSRRLATVDGSTRLSIWEAATSRVVAVAWLDLPLERCDWLPDSGGVRVEFTDGRRCVFDLTPPATLPKPGVADH